MFQKITTIKLDTFGRDLASLIIKRLVFQESRILPITH